MQPRSSSHFCPPSEPESRDLVYLENVQNSSTKPPNIAQNDNRGKYSESWRWTLSFQPNQPIVAAKLSSPFVSTTPVNPEYHVSTQRHVFGNPIEIKAPPCLPGQSIRDLKHRQTEVEGNEAWMKFVYPDLEDIGSGFEFKPRVLEVNQGYKASVFPDAHGSNQYHQLAFRNGRSFSHLQD